MTKILLEILNSAANDVYSNLYAFKTITSLYRAEPTLLNEFTDIVVSLLLKALN